MSANLTSAQRYVSSTAIAAVNTLTVTGVSGQSWKLEFLTVSVSQQPSWLTSPNLQIKDGSTVLWAFDLPPTGSSGFIYQVPLPGNTLPQQYGNTNPTEVSGMIITAGANLVIVVANGGTGCKTIINAKVGVAYALSDGSIVTAN